jgi:hypothetical protein
VEIAMVMSVLGQEKDLQKMEISVANPGNVCRVSVLKILV